MIHDGFNDAEYLVFGYILSEVQRLSATYNTIKVYATGHSLGAALANLTAVNLAGFNFDVSLYNFGQPRVGNKAYSLF